MRPFHFRERSLVGTKKPLLPAHAGEARYQAALDNDRTYRELILAAFGLALIGSAVFGHLAATEGPMRTVLFCILASGFALRSTMRRSPTPSVTKWQPAIVFTSIAGFVWVIWLAFIEFSSPWSGLIAVAGCAALAVMERSLSARVSFAPIVVALVFLHLSVFLGAVHLPSKSIIPQMIVLVLEFCLVGFAGYRHAIASLSRYPRSTYRSSPQCLVPALDHAWDHPIKIDAI